MIGRTVSHYEVLEELGKGGMGVVYKARDLRLDRSVALKFLPAEVGADPLRRQRFVREARAASALSHPHIVTVYDIEEADGQPFVAMELLEGQNLRQRIGQKPLPIAEVFDLALQITDALKAAHEKGIIHRDIKPANIFVTRRGQAKLLDFGLAKQTHAETGPERELWARTASMGLTVPGMPMGTVAYMSPEQARGEPVDARTDIFSLGAVLYEMASGRQAFGGSTTATVFDRLLNHDPESVAESNPDVPPGLAKIIARALQKKREARYSSSAEMLDELRRAQEAWSVPQRVSLPWLLLTRLRNPWVALTTILAVAAAGLGSYAVWQRQARIEWARTTALPEIERLLGNTRLQDVAAAYDLAVQAERAIPGDPRLTELMSRCAITIPVTSEPPGARVFVKEYSSPDAPWQDLGSTPLPGVRLPAGFLRWRLEKDGFEPVEAAATTFTFVPGKNEPLPFHRVLDPKGALPPGMTRVLGGDSAAGKLPDFLLDVYEVTNQQFKAFVDAGGYTRREFWKHPFVKDGKTLAWDEAMTLFVDTTGRPGPSTWEAGDLPEEQENFPVSGVSWYEAAAYAEYAGKALPTVHHWGLAGLPTGIFSIAYLPSTLLSWSNFGKRPAAVGSTRGMNFFGTYDMLGNVREWCSNAHADGHAVRGLAWNDARYTILLVSVVPPFDRDRRNGFRCARYPQPDAIPEAAFRPFAETSATRDYDREKPVSDEAFAAFLDRYAYDRADLAPRDLTRDESSPNWVLEKVYVTAAYGGEKLPILLYIPRNARPPFQTVVYFPGSDLFMGKEPQPNSFEVSLFDFIVKSGRVVALPVYEGAMERITDDTRMLRKLGEGMGSRRWVDYFVKVVMDFRRALDYLETRPDIDGNKLALYGFSEGGVWSPILLTVEASRIKVAVNHLSGLNRAPYMPVADPFNYVQRVKVPVLMLNGVYDTNLTLKEEVEPMYRLLGTPEKDKKLILYETDHFIPRTELIKETLGWFDTYLGPVR